MPQGKVLVLGDDTRSFLGIVRSLGRKGIAVHAAPANFRSAALRSRFIAAIHDLPPWIGDGSHWLSSMEQLLRAERFELVIPCDETTLLPLQHHRAQLAALARLAIPSDKAITLLFDKHETRQLAQRAEVPVARGRLQSPADTAEAVLAEFGAPVVVKPRYSYSLGTLFSRNKVELVSDSARLNQILSLRVPLDTVIEQFFEGQGLGVSLLAANGHILQAFQHHRVHELAGASFYRVSAPLRPDLLHACEQIIASAEYTGLAMFEFKLDKNGVWILLEINARPWGSMPLPIALGIDFPFRWYRLLVADEETSMVPYRTGVYGRNLIPDLRATVTEVRRLKPMPGAWLAIQRAAELLRPLTGWEVQDVLVSDDQRPGWAELTESLVRAWRRSIDLLPGTGAYRHFLVRRRLYQGMRRAAKKPHLLFVCQGNICRSPFAEALARSRLGNKITVNSAGTMPQSGRRTPEFGVAAAAAYGVDLSSHSSVWLNRQALDNATLVIVFDRTNHTALFDRYPDVKVPVINLGQLIGTKAIVDPVDGELREFQKIYEQIATAITKLASAV